MNESISLQKKTEINLTVSRLATLLANGIRVRAGQAFPDGWDESDQGRRRRYVQARPCHIRAARKLLHSPAL